VADVSEAAWRRRRRASAAWLGWLLAELLAPTVPPPPAADLAGRARRVRLLDATHLGQVGGPGDAWRVHLVYDLLAGRMDEVLVTDHHTAEGLGHVALAAGDLVVADRQYGSRRSVALARAAGADLVARVDLRRCPLEDDAGARFDWAAWLAQGAATAAEWRGWCRWEGQRLAVRLIACPLPPAARQRAQRRRRRQVSKKQRRVSAQSLQLAGWCVLLTTLDARTWPPGDILRLYRARWQVELLFKRLKQVLRVQAIRNRMRAAAEATVRALLVAWALQEAQAAALQAALPVGAGARRPASLWRLAHLSLATLAQQVRGGWTAARLAVCLPRLGRFLCDSPRRREQQAASVAAWLAEHPGLDLRPRQEAA
jgi:hypothetical protein